MTVDAAAPTKPRIPAPIFWFTLLALATTASILGFFLFVRSIGSSHWEDARAHYLSQGNSLDIDDFIAAPIPDDENFAAIPALRGITIPTEAWQAARDALEFGVEPDWTLGTGEGHKSGPRINFQRWTDHLTGTAPKDSPLQNDAPDALTASLPNPTEKAAAAKALLSALNSKFAGVFSQSDDASSRLSAQFLPPVSDYFDREIPFQSTLAHLTTSYNFARALCLRASASVHVGDPETALKSIRAILRLADAELAFPAGAFQGSFANSLILKATAALHEGLAEKAFDDNSLTELQSEWARIDAIDSLIADLQMEAISSSLNLQAFKKGALPDFDPPSSTFPIGWIDEARASSLHHLASAIAPLRSRDFTTLQTNLVDCQEWIDGINEKVRSSDNWYAISICCPLFLDRSITSAAHAQAIVVQARTACALERHFLKSGTYPEDLSALVPDFLPQIPKDPMDGNPMRYRTTADGRYLLYSIGWNLLDGGGIPGWESPTSRNLDSTIADWVWSYQVLRPKAPVR